MIDEPVTCDANVGTTHNEAECGQPAAVAVNSADGWINLCAAHTVLLQQQTGAVVVYEYVPRLPGIRYTNPHP